MEDEAVVKNGPRRTALLFAAGLALLAGTLYVTVRGGGKPSTPTTSAAAEFRTVAIPIEGMSCLACVARVKKALKGIEGVHEVEVSLERREAQIQYAPEQVSPERLMSAINNLGYKTGTPRIGSTTK